MASGGVRTGSPRSRGIIASMLHVSRRALAPRTAADAQAVERIRSAIRGARDAAQQQSALQLIDAYQAGGQIPPAIGAQFRALVHRKTGRLDMVLAQTDRCGGLQQGYRPFLLRLGALVESDQYELGQSELKSALSGWLRDTRLSTAVAVRLLNMIERFRADSAVDEYWLKAFARHAAKREEIAAGLQRLAARKANAPAAANVKILSLGIHCLPWVLLNRWGLRTEEDLFTLDSPFNLAGHDIPTLIRTFSTDFEGYTDPDNFGIVKSAKGKDLPVNKRFRAVFNHHRLPYWTDNNFERLLQALEKKVDNVRSILKQRNLVLLIGNASFETEKEARESLSSLYSAVARISAEPPLLIASAQRDFSRPPQITRLDERVYHMNRPYPSPDYVWITDMNGAAGLQYERDYVGDVCSILQAHGLWPKQA